ncbi:universal stress protein [Komagataeibacter sp. FNDCR2]|uniref:universal stress protein n=1 Tax=Komagataeibacter sp. FNDCR2 TaxID=2878682 RepID=UPI001E564150|nr:universal stress protein [Komagataeibacter sp. FNDCR2]MCE2574303.1 universal stress protein [Komagataeibacter sp. FNDCR2]
MKTALIILNRPEDAAGLLAVGLDVVARAGGAALNVLAAREPPEDTILPTEEMLTDRTRAQIRATQRQWADSLHACFHDWLTAGRADGAIGNVEVNWLDPEISVTRMMQAYASEADLIVLGFPQPHDSDQKRRAVHAAIFDSGRPVVFVPPGWNRPAGRNILLAWKDTTSCRRTVRSARPILAAARDVAVLRADTDTPSVLTDLLAGVVARYLPPLDDGAPEDVTRVILRQCRDNGCDLLVMGGYTHGALYNRLVGSVTQDILECGEIPVFLQH